MKALYALHKDDRGKVLGANSFLGADGYSLASWVKGLDIRAGDIIAFDGEVAERPEFDEVAPARPEFLGADEAIPPLPPSTPALADEEEPF